MEIPDLNKKGFSLVEVIVAIGIIAMILAASFTTIGASLNLSIDNRNRTILTQLANSAITESRRAIMESRASCLSDYQLYSDEIQPEGSTYTYAVETSSENFNAVESVPGGSWAFAATTSSIDPETGDEIFAPGRYIKITAIATAVREDGTEESRIEVSQYLRR